MTAVPALDPTAADVIESEASDSHEVSVPDQKRRRRSTGARTHRRSTTAQTATPAENVGDAEEERPRPHIVRSGVPIPEPTWQPGCTPALWWSFYLEGTRGRPAPGTEVLVDRLDRAGNPTVQSMRVLPYEGCWPSHSFPVLEMTGLTTSLSTDHNGHPMGWRYTDTATYVASPTPRYRAHVLGQAS